MEIRTYPIAERPDVIVTIEGRECWGELRQWERHEDGWWGQVGYNTGPGENRIDTVPAEAIRLSDPPA